MTSIGETLRRERLRRSLQLDQVSRELKISVKLLQAIEAEEFNKLPGNIFAKNFVRQYAHFLGLDEEEMAAEMQRILQPQVELPRFADTGKPDAIPIQVPRVEEWETVGDRGFSWASPLPALALFVAAMLVCSAVYAWYQKSRHPVLAQNSPATEQAPPVVVQPAPPVPIQTNASQPAQTAERQAAPPTSPQAQSAQVQPTQQPLPPPPQIAAAQPVMLPATATETALNPNATIHVQITADEPSWVLARSDGKYMFSGTLDANQTRTVDAVKNVELRLGNAGGVTVSLNGKPLGAVGPKGQVRTVQLTPGGFQIVAAPKSPPLSDPR